MKLPTDATRVTAEGMPQINRRRMLLGLAAASTAAAGTAVAGAEAVEAALPPAENPKLIALAAELPAIAAAFHEVNDVYLAAYREWDAKTPWAPDELTVKGIAWPHEEGAPKQPGEPEMRALGGFLWRKGDKYPRHIVVKSWDIYWQIAEARRAKREAKKDGSLPDFMAAEAEIKRLKKLHSVAEAYEEEFREIKRNASEWHSAAYPIKDAKKDALEQHVAAIMDEPEFTMEGVVIKAQALAEWNRVGRSWGDRLAIKYGQDWNGQIAAAILRHAEGGAV